MDLDDKTREEIFWQLLEGIAYLHSMGVMHRDIKPNNMTVVSVNPAHPEARLIDFGLATIGLQSRDYQAGTQQYHAPEMLAGWDNRTNDPYDERVDMFAFGLSMYQFFCGQLCGWQRIDMDSSKKISTSNLTEIENRLFASRNRKELMELISFLISWDPQRRPSAREAMSLGGREQPARSVDEEERARVDRDRDDTQDGGIGSSMGRMSISGAGPISHDRSSRQESRLPHDGSSREENHPGGSRMFASKPPTEYCPLEIPEGGMTQDLNELTHHHLDID